MQCPDKDQRRSFGLFPVARPEIGQVVGKCVNAARSVRDFPRVDAGDLQLILVALLAIGILVVLVTRFRVNAFLSLLLASLAVGASAVVIGRPVRQAGGQLGGHYTMAAVVRSFSEGLGATLGGIATVIALGTMLGKLLAESGGAEVLAKRFAGFFGPKRIQWCIMALALAVGLTTWFAVGFVLLLPILLSLARETRQPFLKLVLPMLACMSVMHGLMPPHPGPVVAVAALNAHMGLVLFWGFVIGIPTAAVAGPLFARYAVRRVDASPPPLPARVAMPLGFRAPGFGLTLFAIVLPVLLMLLATLAELTLPPDSRLRTFGSFIGNPTVALLVAVLFGAWALGTRCGFPRGQILKFTEECVSAMGMTVLIVGGGGGFARVLRDAGVADAIGRAGEAAHLPPLNYAWLLSAFIRVATGSATVAITTASGLLVPVLLHHPELTQHQIALVVVAVGCGSLFLSHLNDSGFWIVKDFLGLSVSQTLRTWTVCETIIGLGGMLLSLVAYQAMAP
jgi:GntP family gluconate:H+ symporter